MFVYFRGKSLFNSLFCEFILFCLITLSFSSLQKSDKRNELKIRSFGCWPSSLSAINATSANLFQEGPIIDSVTGGVFWVLQNLDGVNAIYEYNQEKKSIIRWTSNKYDVRNRVNGRGGGSFVVYNDTIFFSNGNDNILYAQQHSSGSPVPITWDSSKAYADGSYSPKYKILFYIREDLDTNRQYLTAINLTDGEETVLPSDGEFFASPTVSTDNSKLAWIQWNSFNMPWDETKLLVTSLEVGRNSKFLKYIQHGATMMIKWNQNNELFYVHDSSDWWNLYINNRRNFELNLTPFEANVGQPLWKLGKKAYDINMQIGNNNLVVTAGKFVYIVDSVNLKRRQLNLTLDSIFEPKFSIDGSKIYMLAGNGTESLSLIEVDLKTSEEKVLFSPPRYLGYDDISQPHFIQISSKNNESAYGYLYKARNSNMSTEPLDFFPPVIINVHSGPTQMVNHHLNLEIQYFTTRGFAFFDLIYRGSAGFGRKFRQSIYGKYGTADTEDIISAAKYLIREKLVDPDKVIVRGIASGGFPALLALSKSDIFRAGTIYGGISNMSKQIEDAHPFEKSYYRTLFLPREIKENFTDTISPIQHSEKIKANTLFFHGHNDEFINLNQSVQMHEKLVDEGKESEMHLEKEGQEFSLKSKARCLQLELRFYKKVLKLGKSV